VFSKEFLRIRATRERAAVGDLGYLLVPPNDIRQTPPKSALVHKTVSAAVKCEEQWRGTLWGRISTGIGIPIGKASAKGLLTLTAQQKDTARRHYAIMQIEFWKTKPAAYDHNQHVVSNEATLYRAAWRGGHVYRVGEYGIATGVDGRWQDQTFCQVTAFVHVFVSCSIAGVIGMVRCLTSSCNCHLQT
jgi:hypothetical protein